MNRWLCPLLLAASLGATAFPVAAEEAHPGVKVHAAGARTDTLSSPSGDVYRAAMLQLEKDDWTIQRSDPVKGRIVTNWKKMNHPLARLFFGDLQARCVVDVAPLSETSSTLTFRGGLAGPEDLDKSAGYGAALTAYRKAAERWAGRVRATLDAPLSAATPAAR